MDHRSKINNISDIEIDYSIIGKNPGTLCYSKASIIFLPGFGCDFKNHQVFKELLISYDYYAINFPAHGNSPWYNADNLTLKSMADLVIEFINERQLEKVILIGHSSSAAIVALINGLIPDTILANVLVSPIDSSFQTDAAEVRDILIPRIPEAVVQLQRLKVFNYDMKSLNNKYWDDKNKEALAFYNKNHEPLNIIFDYLTNEDLKRSIESIYSNIKIPTLAVFGDSDGMLRTPLVSSNMKRLIDNLEVAVIPMAGHEPYYDNPKNYYSNVVNFIDKVVFNYDNKIKQDETIDTIK